MKEFREPLTKEELSKYEACPKDLNARLILSLNQALEAALFDAKEQSQLNGMGAERELRLMARVQELEKNLLQAYAPKKGTLHDYQDIPYITPSDKFKKD